jgi:hypothetical protein
MAQLTDPETLARYKQALADWTYQGAIVLKGRAPDSLRTTLEGMTERQFKELLFRFVCEEGGEIDQVKEQREQWRMEAEFHYDLRPIIAGVKVYVETRLLPESFTSRDEPMIHIVQIKPA